MTTNDNRSQSRDLNEKDFKKKHRYTEELQAYEEKKKKGKKVNVTLKSEVTKLLESYSVQKQYPRE